MRILIAAACLWGAPAFGHDKWASGEPVPAWVKAACCGPNDAHHLQLGQVHREKGGYRVDGYPEIIPYDTVLPSQDGEIWGFWTDWSDTQKSRVFCFFMPVDGV